MKKAKKFLALAVAFVLTITGTAGITIAWLQDDDVQTNTFTVGNVAIDLIEYGVDKDGEQVLFESEEALKKLLPATGSAQDNTLENGVVKEVTVKNTGSEDAYIRVQIAIPSILDDGDPTFNAGKNVLHFNYDSESVGAGKWDWSKEADDGKYEGDWNFYKTTINNVEYNVYVVTYESIVKAGDTIDEFAMHQVYLDKAVTNEYLAELDDKLGGTDPEKFDGKWDIHVIAEGVQEAGFDNAYEALNSAFGEPGKYTVKWN